MFLAKTKYDEIRTTLTHAGFIVFMLASLLAIVALPISCAISDVDALTTETAPPPAPLQALPAVFIPPDNPMSPEKIELGKMLFFDTRLSGNVSTSCASCHDPKVGWGDGGELSRGYAGSLHWRNSDSKM